MLPRSVWASQHWVREAVLAGRLGVSLLKDVSSPPGMSQQWLGLMQALVLEPDGSCCGLGSPGRGQGLAGLLVLPCPAGGELCPEAVPVLGVEKILSSTCEVSLFPSSLCTELEELRLHLVSSQGEQRRPRRRALLSCVMLHGTFAVDGAGICGGFSDWPPLQPLQVLAFSIESLKEPKDDTVWRERQR